MDLTEKQYDAIVRTIKCAILRNQYKAIASANRTQLSLYYGIGRYISANSRSGYWGTQAVAEISRRLQSELPGLRGFSTRNLKNMRTFYEEWQMLEDDSAVATADLLLSENVLENRQSQLPIFPYAEFVNVGFTHHIAILSQVKDYDQRCFYIKICSEELLSVDVLKRFIKEDVYHKRGALPNNFLAKLSDSEMARRAIMSFKDEYLLDFINVEELGARDIEDVDERLVEQKIVHNIKKFIMSFGHDFSFIGNQFRVDAFGHTHIIDLLFFNRELSSLVAIELKTGSFKPAYLGQLNMYLQVLDDFVRKPNENPSIGIVLCKSADRTYAEYAVRDYDKPMGVATFKTSSDMPERFRGVLPDVEVLKQIL